MSREPNPLEFLKGNFTLALVGVKYYLAYKGVVVTGYNLTDVVMDVLDQTD